MDCYQANKTHVEEAEWCKPSVYLDGLVGANSESHIERRLLACLTRAVTSQVRYDKTYQL
jgi:hypothetical protein